MTHLLLILIFFLSCAFIFFTKNRGRRKWGSNNASEKYSSNELLASGIALPKQLIGGLYEFHKPNNGEAPNFEVVFFHGLQQHGDASRAHADTWISFDGSNSFYWPQQLLAADFPRARIFTVSYDSCISKDRTRGRFDLHLVAENLLWDLTHDFGHRSGCPVILVGKDVGGLVIKKTCLLAANDRSTDREKYQKFLGDIRGLLYYCTPHLGFRQWPKAFDGAMFKNVGSQDVELARLNSEFNRLNRPTFNWRTKVIAGNPSIEADELCIPEGSSREGSDDYYTVPHDLHSVARPHDKADITYSFLRELMLDAISEPSSSSESDSESSLLFTWDDNYVPVEKTIQKIDKAFEKSNIVLLHGDSGTGKSSLVRFYALRFEKDMKMGSLPVVSYVSCGCEAVISDIEVELLSTFKFQYPKQESRTFGPEETQSQKMSRLHTLFVNHLRGLDALVILDDVWETELLDKVLVSGKKLRYLITTRDADRWPDPASERIKIDELTRDEGRRILTNYAKFEPLCIPQHLQVQADELIEDVQCHPLALATLGAVLQVGNKSSVDTWKSLRDELLAYMESNRYKSLNCGKSYPRSVSAALMLAVDDKILGADAINLLYVINLFQGPRISESLVQSFLKYSRPTALNYLNENIRVLEALSLVQVEILKPSASQFHITNQSSGHESDAFVSEVFVDNEKAQFKREFLIHDLRQRVILQEKKGDIDRVTGFLRGNRDFYYLENRADDDWATLLCAISGVSSVRKDAQQKMGRYYKWNPRIDSVTEDANPKLRAHLEARVEALVRRELSYVLADTLALLPVSIEESRLNNEPGPSNGCVASNEVIWTLLIDRNIDFYKVSALLRRRHSVEWACSFLKIIFTLPTILPGMLPSALQLERSMVEVRGCANTLIALLAQDTMATIRENVLSTFITLLLLAYRQRAADLHSVDDQQECLFNTKELLHTLTRGPFLAKDIKSTCFKSLMLINLVITTSCHRCRAVIMDTAGCFDKLAELLTEDVDGDLQEAALATLQYSGIIGTSPYDAEKSVIMIRAFATSETHSLSKIVSFLSQNLENRLQLLTRMLVCLSCAPRGAALIVNCPTALHKLVELLAEDVPADEQDRALATLCNITGFSMANVNKNDTIFAVITADVLLRIIVPFLSQDPERKCRCKTSVDLIANLAISHSCRVLIFNFPRCWQSLVELLVEDVAAELQEGALFALGNIATYFDAVDENDLMFPTVNVACDLLLSKIVPFVSQDLGGKCEQAVRLIQNLAGARSRAVMIINYPNCLQKLIELLVEDVSTEQQEGALSSLCRIAPHIASVDKNNMMLKTVVSDLLLRIVPYISRDQGRRSQLSSQIIWDLAKERSCAALIISCNSLSYLHTLVELLGEDVAVDRQLYALETLCITVSHSGLVDENDTILASVASDLLLRILPLLRLPFLSQDPESLRRCEQSLRLIWLLAGARNCAETIINYPSCLEKVVELLVEAVPANLQYAAIIVLEQIAGHDAAVNPVVVNDFAMDATEWEQLSVRHVIEKRVRDMHNVGPDIRAALYRRWYLRHALRGAYPAALSDINKALELDPGNSHLWQERGVLRRLMADYHGALEDLDRALEIDTDDYECLKHRAFVKFLMGNERGASADAERAILIQPSRVNDESYGHGCLGVLSVSFMTYELR